MTIANERASPAAIDVDCLAHLLARAWHCSDEVDRDVNYDLSRPRRCHSGHTKIEDRFARVGPQPSYILHTWNPLPPCHGVVAFHLLFPNHLPLAQPRAFYSPYLS